MVTFLTYISNACHSLSGVAERLQHTPQSQAPMTRHLPGLACYPPYFPEKAGTPSYAQEVSQEHPADRACSPTQSAILHFHTLQALPHYLVAAPSMADSLSSTKALLRAPLAKGVESSESRAKGTTRFAKPYYESDEYLHVEVQGEQFWLTSRTRTF